MTVAPEHAREASRTTRSSRAWSLSWSRASGRAGGVGIAEDLQLPQRIAVSRGARVGVHAHVATGGGQARDVVRTAVAGGRFVDLRPRPRSGARNVDLVV